MILLVEDEDVLRHLLARILRGAGYQLMEAANGEEALDRARGQQSIDVLVTDVVMPKLGGVELAHRLRDGHPDMHVIYMSGYPKSVVREQGPLVSGAPWLVKPFAPNEFLRVVRSRLHAPPAPAVVA